MLTVLIERLKGMSHTLNIPGNVNGYTTQVYNPSVFDMYAW